MKIIEGWKEIKNVDTGCIRITGSLFGGYGVSVLTAPIIEVTDIYVMDKLGIKYQLGSEQK